MAGPLGAAPPVRRRPPPQPTDGHRPFQHGPSRALPQARYRSRPMPDLLAMHLHVTSLRQIPVVYMRCLCGLEQESGFYFNMKHFEDLVQGGEWDEVERYLSGFTKVEDNRYSMKIFFEIHKQKYLKALARHDRAKAVEILVKDLKVFASFNEELFKEITRFLTLENFSKMSNLSKYGDTKSARNIMLLELKKLIEANPCFGTSLNVPPFKASSLAH
ncbi:unnamed protein product [Miscanthus lutarioriparius]|uniref:CTLH domain-containing protein n=1 Tax=Miscanthus lutarioriparius TaxID=422564 RepID=A0A811QWB7_9POAL|nr:unnamed protein product [Miscanthus lutarioriparius]